MHGCRYLFPGQIEPFPKIVIQLLFNDLSVVPEIEGGTQQPLLFIFRDGGFDHKWYSLYPGAVAVGCWIVLAGFGVDNERDKDIIDLIIQHLVDMTVHDLNREACFSHDLVQGLFHSLAAGLLRGHHIESKLIEKGAPVGELLVKDHQSTRDPNGRFSRIGTRDEPVSEHPDTFLEVVGDSLALTLAFIQFILLAPPAIKERLLLTLNPYPSDLALV